MRDNTKKKAPRPAIPSKKKPLAFFKENDKAVVKKNPMGPMAKKRLSK